MFKSSIQTIEKFKEVLLQLPGDCYMRPCLNLSGATIGQHTRHIIELYQCLLEGYKPAVVCYDKRKRDKRIEQDMHFAVDRLQRIQNALEQPKRKLLIYLELNGTEEKIESNYFREVLYNLEHTIHHQALIKVAINEFTDIQLSESFGVAPSTMQYRSECAQ